MYLHHFFIKVYCTDLLCLYEVSVLQTAKDRLLRQRLPSHWSEQKLSKVKTDLMSWCIRHQDPRQRYYKYIVLFPLSENILPDVSNCDLAPTKVNILLQSVKCIFRYLLQYLSQLTFHNGLINFCFCNWPKTRPKNWIGRCNSISGIMYAWNIFRPHRPIFEFYTLRRVWLGLNKPKMAYSCDLPKMAV